MPDAKNRKIVCPECGGSHLEPKSVVVGVQPYQRPEPPDGPRPVRVVERKYRCQDCSREFSIVEEIFE